MFDAVYVPGGAASVETLLGEADAVHFINEMYKHCKAIGASGEGVEFIDATYVGAIQPEGELTDGTPDLTAEGVVLSSDARAAKISNDFINAIAKHRHWSRELEDLVPA